MLTQKCPKSTLSIVHAFMTMFNIIYIVEVGYMDTRNSQWFNSIKMTLLKRVCRYQTEQLLQ